MERVRGRWAYVKNRFALKSTCTAEEKRRVSTGVVAINPNENKFRSGRGLYAGSYGTGPSCRATA